MRFLQIFCKRIVKNQTLGGHRLVKILCVDDSTLQKNELVKFLKSLGYSVKGASNGVEALALITEGFLPDVLLTDLFMPEMDGLELIEEINKKGLNILAIVLSTHVHNAIEKKGQELGVISFIKKPFNYGKLRDVLEKALN
ncbi:MAG: response regulator [Epsilonproteobacteria bacterium]|nr:MAG: response regulator [Campylobacterota bacterium]RLA63873.1 MAG: response regulator [Campylobacterota bacterium]